MDNNELSNALDSAAPEELSTQPDTTQTGEGENEAPAAEDKKEDPQEAANKGFLRRIDKLTRKNYEYRAEAEHAKKIVAQYEAQRSQEGQEPERAAQMLDPKEIYRQAEAKVIFDTKCNSAWKDGVKEFGDEFEGAISSLKAVADLDVEKLSAIVDCDAPHKVLHYLGQNPDEAADILDLPPLQLARKLARLEARIEGGTVSTPKPVSKAPTPPTAIRGKSVSNDSPSDGDDTATWMRKEAERMRKAGVRI